MLTLIRLEEKKVELLPDDSQCLNPNLQQIPAKGFIGKNMRALFLPEEGCSWGSFDYSQQEPRIVVHYALKLENERDRRSSRILSRGS